MHAYATTFNNVNVPINKFTNPPPNFHSIRTTTLFRFLFVLASLSLYI